MTSRAQSDGVAGQTRSDVALLYRRAGFGLRGDELDRAAAGGYEAAVDQLMAGLGAAPDPTGDQVPLPTFTPFTRVGGNGATAGSDPASYRGQGPQPDGGPGTGGPAALVDGPDDRHLHPAPGEAHPVLARPLRHRRVQRSATPS